VVFAAADIDMDVFSSAINRIGPLAGKITVITATNDRALALSGRIAGGMTRVGAAEKAAIERLGVRDCGDRRGSRAYWGGNRDPDDHSRCKHGTRNLRQ
jgi:hypothetical protein